MLMGLAAVLVLASPASAQTAPRPLEGSNRTIDDLCLFVAENILDTSGGAGKWAWQSLFYSAGGVTRAEVAAKSPAINDKMRSWWAANQDRLTCNVVNSIVRDGSILRLAVDSASSDFLRDAVWRWKVDLNYRDRRDGGTVLDFVDAQIAHSPTSPRVAFLKRYANWFEMHGGKRARDLD